MEEVSRVNALLEEILPANRFQTGRLGAHRRLSGPDDFARLPLLTKRDLAADAIANGPFGTNLTYPLENYTRFHQTSGTTGTPLRVLDTPATWDWWGRCWGAVLRQAGVTAADRLFFAFSFAPSIGFWSAFHGATMMGALCIPSGGASTRQRLRMILDTGATAILCTPSYALHLAEEARKEGIAIRGGPVRVLIHAGEAGASIPATRRRLEEAWGAPVLDHAGATEVGAWGIGTPDGRGLVVNEEEFVAEVLDPASGGPVAPGGTGELVLTNLGRGAWPVLRYRTGDLVRPSRQADGTLLLEGGILGRLDDMVTIRGLNVYPSALEEIIRSVPGTAEFQIVASRPGEMDELALNLEGDAALAGEVRRRIDERLGLRVEVAVVPPGSLPRGEGKAKRFVDHRHP
ncbi:MAG TPA: AMP-binding protein [Planctomycetota bacterium]|nr:AMP-binding protein [Planctomycetota bacterium]